MVGVNGIEGPRTEDGGASTAPLSVAMDRDNTVDEFLPARRSAEQPAEVPTPASAQIFISYKVSPDERIATALKRLIEGSIDPPPNVFVSGVGGIRPSNIGAIPQMQHAAASVRAFVGVITQASKDREWIFFEAGAAWGRNCLYAPLLVGTTPEDLPNSICGYQATFALDQEKMRLLLTELANAVGGSVKGRFGTRYGPFERVLRKYPEGETEDIDDNSDDLERAVQHFDAGRHDEATAAFARLEQAAAGDALRQATVRLSRIVNDPRIAVHQRLAQLEKLEGEAASISDYQFWRALFEPRRHVKITHLKRCLELAPDSLTRELAIRALAENLDFAGRQEEAADLLWSVIDDCDRSLRARAALQLLKTSENADPVARLLLACSAVVAAPPDDVLTATKPAVEIAQALSFHQLEIFLARRYSRIAADGMSANAEGIALAAAGFRSLAYLAYERAALAGISVAKANMASLLEHGSVPAAGLLILERHAGSFDAAAPHYPHRVRALLEERIHDERARAARLESVGERFHCLLAELSERAAAARGSRPLPHASYRVRGEVYNAGPVPTEGNWTFARNVADKIDSFAMVPGLPYDNLWIRREADVCIGIYLLGGDGALTGLRLDLDGDGGSVAWETMEPSGAHHPELTSTSPSRTTLDEGASDIGPTAMA